MKGGVSIIDLDVQNAGPTSIPFASSYEAKSVSASVCESPKTSVSDDLLVEASDQLMNSSNVGTLLDHVTDCKMKITELERVIESDVVIVDQTLDKSEGQKAAEVGEWGRDTRKVNEMFDLVNTFEIKNNFRWKSTVSDPEVHLSYGVDVLDIHFDEVDRERLTVASCSFYENILEKWEVTF